jgi:hypothetical protein
VEEQARISPLSICHPAKLLIAHRYCGERMDASDCNPTGATNTFEVKGRVNVEAGVLQTGVLQTLVSPQHCQERTSHPSCPHGAHLFLRLEHHAFKARPYLEFDRYNQHETHFQVLTAVKPPVSKVILSNTPWGP